MRDAVAILVPVLGRPDHVASLLHAIQAATPEPHRVVFLADRNDADELAALDHAGAQYVTGRWPRPNYPAKINAGVDATGEPFVFLGADDIRPQAGWLSMALALMDDPAIGVVGTNDGGVNPRVAAGDHSTHSLVRRSYIEEHGTIDEPGRCVHEGYGHAFVDDELVMTARIRGAYAHAHGSVVEHRHPYGNSAVMDDTYRLGMSTIARDQRLWQSRRRLLTVAR